MSGITVTDRKVFRRYKAGYEIWDEIWTNGGEPIPMRQAYTPDGAYIGSPKDAYFLARKKGIRPEKASPSHNVCSIGFCEREQKWYGWSHRAIYGFGVGSTVKQGDCGYVPTDKEDFRLDCIRFWDDEHHAETWAVADERGPDGEPGVLVSWRYAETVPNEKLRSKISGVFCPYPDQFGQGEWTAATLDDARQMARDFAEGVS